MLGPVSLLGPAGASSPGGPKERTVLALLTIHADRLVADGQLIHALWADEPPRTAGRTLQAYISRLRRALSAGGDDTRIEAAAGGYVLHATGDGIDVRVVERLAEQARAVADDDPARSSELLSEALAKWSGEAYGDLADEPWAQAEAVRLSELRATLFAERVDADLRCGRHALVVGELEAACRLDPYREQLWGQLIVALYRSGRQADALSAARELRQRLLDDLGVDPSPELQALERAILTQDPALRHDVGARTDTEQAPVGAPFPSGLVAVPPSDFVGRGRELAELHACMKDVGSAGCQAVFVGGEPGIGKSRLVSEFARGVHAAGGTVLLGACDEGLDMAYQPFAEALGSLVPHLPDDVLGSHVRKHGGELARLVPELSARIGDLPPPLGAEPDAERYRLFEAIASLLEDVSHLAPTVLVLDDLQWANEPTLLLLRHLLGHKRPGSLLIVGLYRTTETSDILTDTLADLRRSPDVCRIVLEGLDQEAAADLIGSIFGVELDAEGRDFARRLHDETGGSPFFVREMIAHLVESGAIVAGADINLGAVELPASVREVIARRLGRLPERTRELLTLAAAIGPSFSLHLLRAAHGETEDEELLDAVEEAIVAGVIRDVGRPGTYAFTHALVFRAVADSTSPLRRARLHRRIAEALEAFGSVDIAEIARHYLAAAADGVADRAIETAVAAAEAAAGRVAYEEAVRFYERALEVAEWTGHERTPTTVDLLIGLGNALWKTGAVLPSRETFDRAATLARDLGDRERFAVAALRNPADLGGFAHALGADHRLVGLLEEALAGLGEADSPLCARVLARLAVELFYTPGAETRRSALADRAVALAERSGDPRDLLYALHCREWATAGPDVPSAERMIRTDALLRLAAEQGNAEIAYRVRFLRFVSALEAGDFDRMDEEAGHARRLADELGVPAFVPWIGAYEALRTWARGRLEEGDALSAAALEDALRGRPDPDLVFAVVGSQQILFRYLRPVGDALSILEPMVETFGDFVPLVIGSALAYMLDGRDEDCRRMYERMADEPLPREGTWLLNMGILGMCCAYLEDTDRAAGVYAELEPFADRWVATVVTTLGPVSRVLGLLAYTMGRYDDAIDHLEHAVASTRVAGTPVFWAESCYDLARALRARGDGADDERITALVERAGHTADELGLRVLEGWIEEAFTLARR